MKKLLSEKFVRRAMRDWLFRNSWGRNYKEKETHEKGVDIQVKNNKWPGFFFIETKGESKNRAGGEVAFVYGLGQIVTRMKIVDRYAYNYGLALPESIAKIAIRRTPWRLTRELCLHIFSVNRNGKVKKYSWQDLKKIQKKSQKFKTKLRTN